ncbi:MAG: hypothetical protein ACRCVV_14855 [Shewanella sp.]
MDAKEKKLSADEVMRRLGEAKAIVMSASRQLMSEKFIFRGEETFGERKR